MGKTIGSPALDALKPPRIFISFATADGAAFAGESPARPGGGRARHLAAHCGAAGRAGLVDADRGGAEVGGARNDEPERAREAGLRGTSAATDVETFSCCSQKMRQIGRGKLKRYRIISRVQEAARLSTD
jgi:hypothetical protein